MTLEGERNRGINIEPLPQREGEGSQVIVPPSPVGDIHEFLDRVRRQIGAQKPKKRIPQGWH